MYSNNRILILFYIGSLQSQSFVAVWNNIFGIHLVKCYILSLHNCCACTEQTQSLGSFYCPCISEQWLLYLNHLQSMGNYTRNYQSLAHWKLLQTVNSKNKNVYNKVTFHFFSFLWMKVFNSSIIKLLTTIVIATTKNLAYKFCALLQISLDIAAVWL